MGDLVMITGASSGLGLALAGMAPFAARVVDFSRSGPPPGSGIEHRETDLSDVAAWPGLAATIRSLVDEEAPSRCVLIHAAGTLTPIGFAGEVDPDSYRRNVLLNSASGQIIGDAFLDAVRGRDGRFDLVMISSGAAKRERPGWSAYGAGKAALDHWVRHVGEEQRLRGGVRVCAIAPGVLDTSMQAEIRQTSEIDFPSVERFRSMQREGDLVAPDDAATRLWRLLETGVETGSVLDLRDFG